jgi:hypothetical protein
MCPTCHHANTPPNPKALPSALGQNCPKLPPNCSLQSCTIQRRPNLDSSWLPLHIHVTCTMTHPPRDFQPLQPPWHAPTGTWHPAACLPISGQVHPIYPRPKLGSHDPHDMLQRVAASYPHPTRPWDPPSQNCSPARTVSSALRAVLGLTRPNWRQKCWKSDSLQVTPKALVFKRVIRGLDLATRPKSSVMAVPTPYSDSPRPKTQSWVLGPSQSNEPIARYDQSKLQDWGCKTGVPGAPRACHPWVQRCCHAK